MAIEVQNTACLCIGEKSCTRRAPEPAVCVVEGARLVCVGVPGIVVVAIGLACVPLDVIIIIARVKEKVARTRPHIMTNETLAMNIL